VIEPGLSLMMTAEFQELKAAWSRAERIVS